MFEEIPEDIFNQAIKEISKENKYMPNASELYDKCSSLNKNNLMNIANYMYQDGYFYRGVKRLSDEQSLRNFDKTIMWLEKGIIPSFLKEDMQEYMKKYNKMYYEKKKKEKENESLQVKSAGNN